MICGNEGSRIHNFYFAEMKDLEFLRFYYRSFRSFLDPLILHFRMPQVLPLLLANANEMEMDAKIVKYLITVNDTFQIFRTQMTFFFRRQEQNNFHPMKIDTCMIKCPTMRYFV